jgi:hypothetical protein
MTSSPLREVPVLNSFDLKWNVLKKGHNPLVLPALELLAYFQELDLLWALVYNRKHGFAPGSSAGPERPSD